MLPVTWPRVQGKVKPLGASLKERPTSQGRARERAPMTPGCWVVDHLEEGSFSGCYCPGLLSPPACGLLLLRSLSEVAVYLQIKVVKHKLPCLSSAMKRI